MGPKGAAKIARHRALSREVQAEKDRWRAAGEVGPLRLTRAQYSSIHRDFRADPSSPRSCTVLATGGTVLVPVEIV